MKETQNQRIPRFSHPTLVCILYKLTETLVCVVPERYSEIRFMDWKDLDTGVDIYSSCDQLYIVHKRYTDRNKIHERYIVE